VPRKGGEGGIPGTTLVLDEASGGVRAVVNSRALTALRNAAGKLTMVCEYCTSYILSRLGSVLATQLLATPTPSHITLFGAGLQIKQHARLLTQTYSSIKHCTIINRSSNERFNQLLADLRSEFPNVTFEGLVSSSPPNPQIESAVQGADVICTATSSTYPLFDSTWLKPGAHVNLIGSYTPAMREADVGLIKRAGRRIVVDEAKSCLVEAGELVDAEVLENEMVEIGVLVRGGVEGEVNVARVKEAGDVTVFKSVGVGAQDVAIAALMVELAERDGKVGVRVPYD
jgi:ornithine cyclodeaminase/alanine dehydrogenase-like protein (mu-crystallin family)